ncbi:MAG TPA: hypothetical protein VFT98_01450 [Myxococcota bacterium]|nr:hypothetical protein [Myxococcota bacterium]
MRIPKLLLPMLVAALAAADAAQAGCCTIRKLDETFPSVTVRACEPNVAGGCASVLFEGPLSLGDSRNVCSAQPTLIYQEAAPGEPFGPFVEAVCTGADVEI